jgi:hypothetical protein
MPTGPSEESSDELWWVRKQRLDIIQFCRVPHFCTVSKDPPLPADVTLQKPLQTYINELFKNMISKQRKPKFFTANNQHPIAIYSGGTKHLSTNSF